MDNDTSRNWQIALASVVGQVGCLTVILIVLALVLGRWLDSLVGTTQPWFTIAFILGSVPVTLFLMVRVALRATSRLNTPPTQTSSSTEVNNSDDDDTAET